jgi:IMP dehydrogenase
MIQDNLSMGLSFDDVTLVPGRSGVLPADADISTRLTADVALAIPVISAAMDTVSEARLAMALARAGGLGIIHRNCTLEQQVQMVARVKRAENIVIAKPETVTPETTIAQLKQRTRETGVDGFPVIDADGVVIGMVTGRDIWVEENEAVAVREVMTPRERLVTAPLGISEAEAKRILHAHRIEKLPLVDDGGRLVGLMTASDISNRLQYRQATKDAEGRLRVGAAIGVGPQALRSGDALVEAGCDVLAIDAATGHTESLLSQLAVCVKRWPNTPVIAGNVVTAEGARDLMDAGAAGIKVGVGPGSICTTRVVAGVGIPQFSAIREVAPVCRERGVPVIADGGIRYSGDIVKALAAGADAVMLGSLLAGTEESPGKLARWQGRTFKEYRGMGSAGALAVGARDRYGQEGASKFVPEGVEARIPYRGPLRDLVFQLMGGLRAGMGYVGAADLDALRQKARFMQVTASGLKESHPHDVAITEEPINYPTF